MPYIVEMGSGVDAAYPFAEDASTANLKPGDFPNGAYQAVANDTTTRAYYVLQYAPPRNYIMMWNLNAQHAFGSHSTLLVGYVGSRGVHNWYQTDDGNIVLPTASDPKTHTYYWPTSGGTVVHGLEGQISYTWSRCIDTSSGSAASDQYRNSLNVDLYIDARTHRGPCDTNIGARLHWIYQYGRCSRR